MTVGTFDGVHRGHQALMTELCRRAVRAGLESTVVTFDRHPAEVVRPGRAPALLNDLDHRLQLLAATGVDRVVVVAFDSWRAAQEPEDFVSELLAGELAARLVLVGVDFRFGRARRGDVDLLERLGKPLGMDVVHLDLVSGSQSGPVSSTAIRALVAAGDVEGAAELLGRPYELRGRVVAGDGRGGAELGFPTANIEVGERLALPGLGIYCGWFSTAGDPQPRAAAVSVGVRPTYGPGGAAVVEAHLLDFSGDLYGQSCRLVLTSRIRAEQRFDSTEALVAAIVEDVAETRRRLGTPDPG